MQDYSEPPKDIEKFKQIAAEIPKWNQGSLYGNIRTYTTSIDGDSWAARISAHPSPPFEKFKSVLFENHTDNEANYIDSITEYGELDAPAPWRSFHIEYSMPFPLGKRTFVIWILTEQISENEFFILSLPRTSDLPGKRGRYLSVELVEKTPTETIWTMGTTADAGGIPQFLQNWKLAGTIAKDVPAVLEYMKYHS